MEFFKKIHTTQKKADFEEHKKDILRNQTKPKYYDSRT